MSSYLRCFHLLLVVLYDNAVCDDVICSTIVLKEKRRKTDRKEKRKTEILDDGPNQCTENRKVNNQHASISFKGMEVGEIVSNY